MALSTTTDDVAAALCCCCLLLLLLPVPVCVLPPGVSPWHFEQYLEEAVFIPGGLADLTATSVA
jgi:hypothetical protein